MKRISSNIVTTIFIMFLTACTTNRTGYTFDKWIHEDSFDGVILEALKTASHRTGFFTKELVGVYDETYRVRNTRNEDFCVFFNVSKKRNVSFHGKFKKGGIVQAGEAVRVGRVYMRDGSRSWTVNIKIRPAYECKE